MAETTRNSVPTATNADKEVAAYRMPFVLRLLILSLVVPFFFQIGVIQMSMSRFVLTLWIVPGLIMWLQGRAGRIRVADVALLGMCFWVALGYSVLHGPGLALEPSGIFFIETMGPYLVARCYIRSADDFFAVVRMLFWVVMLMLPFALYEAMTKQNILLEFANRVTFSGYDVPKDPRWGLDRVQGVFQHPIHFGIFCGGMVALTYYVLGYGVPLWKRWFRTALITGTAFLSLSSGPLTAIIAQLGLISWDCVLHRIKQRWIILSSGILSLVVAIEIAANRSTPEIFISFFAFNSYTAYARILIWRFGVINVQQNPLFGVGLGTWYRPEWKSGSMDMYWLQPAVFNGLPAALLLQLAFFALFIPIIFKSGLSDRSSNYRMGYLACMVGFYLGGWTVHYWKVIYVFFIFLLGAGAWLLDDNKQEEKDATHPEENKTTSGVLKYKRAGSTPRYTRYGHKQD